MEVGNSDTVYFYTHDFHVGVLACQIHLAGVYKVDRALEEPISRIYLGLGGLPLEIFLVVQLLPPSKVVVRSRLLRRRLASGLC